MEAFLTLYRIQSEKGTASYFPALMPKVNAPAKSSYLVAVDRNSLKEQQAALNLAHLYAQVPDNGQQGRAQALTDALMVSR